MSKVLRFAAVVLLSSMVNLAIECELRAQSYGVTADMTSQDLGNGTFDYTIHLRNDASASVSINTFWFAWVPNIYGYDLMPSAPSVTQSPAGWYPYVINSPYYYPDGYSIEFYNSGGPALNPGQTFTFEFTSADSPTTLGQNSPYFGAPTLTSFAYATYPGYDSGEEFVVSMTPAPEPSTLGLMLASAIALGMDRQRRKRSS